MTLFAFETNPCKLMLLFLLAYAYIHPMKWPTFISEYVVFIFIGSIVMTSVLGNVIS